MRVFIILGLYNENVLLDYRNYVIILEVFMY